MARRIVTVADVAAAVEIGYLKRAAHGRWYAVERKRPKHRQHRQDHQLVSGRSTRRAGTYRAACLLRAYLALGLPFVHDVGQLPHGLGLDDQRVVDGRRAQLDAGYRRRSGQSPGRY